MPPTPLFPRRRALIAVTVFVTAGLAACVGAEAADGAAAPGDDVTTVRFALDWTPNTNHTGLYVAMNKGYFADAGIDVEVVPYNSSGPDVLIDAGQAEFGVATQHDASVSMSAGADLISVLAVEQTWATEISVLADRDDIRSPADLDGKVYGGFGLAAEEIIVRGVIQGAGGKGEFDNVVLGTTAYEALYSGDVDFTEPYVAWEGIEAAHRGVALKSFAYTDYGFPDSYQMLVLGNKTWLGEHPDVAAAFVGALARGYEDAVADPVEAATILQEENKDLLTDLDFLIESQQLLAEKYMLDESGEFGRQTEKQWSELGAFLFGSGLLVDADGAPRAEQPDWATFFTNEYLDA
ncbi:MAG TPA: ABC transporter substrate-binding protein [Arachnia sp.]|nr:ABC transporter substrate-binding protein [Arachnia sp.]HMT86562.1 ABC transporter substrate-binding protein [Arachnia sp.]